MIFNIILILCFTIFLLRIIVFSIGAIIERKKGKSKGFRNEMPFVTVVVPARNEENNIAACIASIVKSNYPIDHFEIIAVNDRSSDSTLSILTSLTEKYTNLKICNITDETAIKNLKGKPGALQAGINEAKGSIILMTDADCTVNQDWIESMAKTFDDPEIGLAAGYTAIKAKTIFDNIQSVEWIYLQTIATAGIGLNIPYSCFGNNLVVRKEIFDNLGGYKGIKFSVTEDLALLQAVHKKGHKLRYLTDQSGIITTLPCADLKDYLKQHHRWVIGGMALGLKAFIFVMTSMLMWIGIVISLITWQPYWLLAFVIERILGDLVFLIPAVLNLKQNKVIKWLVPSIFFFMLMEIIAPFLLLKSEVNWKGQIFK